jgi:hypothetical protein
MRYVTFEALRTTEDKESRLCGILRCDAVQSGTQVSTFHVSYESAASAFRLVDGSRFLRNFVTYIQNCTA